MKRTIGTAAFVTVLAALLMAAQPVSRRAAAAQRYTVIDLGTLSGGSESGAPDINARGQVVGHSDTASGQTHAILWAQ